MSTRTLCYVVVVLAVLASLAGCAASPGIVSSPDADRQAKLFLSSADTAAIFVYRDSGWAGGPPLMLVRNGRIATWTWPGYFVLFEVPPGAQSLLSLGGANVASLTINAEPGRVYYVSQEPTSGWGRTIDRTELYQVDAERGRDRVLKSKRLRAND